MGKSCGYLGKDILGERKSRRRVWPEQSKGKVGGDGGGGGQVQGSRGQIHKVCHLL